MGSFEKLFGTDKRAEEEGIEVDLGEGLTVRVARANNKTYQAVLRRKFEAHRRQIRNRTIPEDVVEKLTVEAMAEGILIGWTGATDGDAPLAYSRENAISMLTKYPDFRDTVSDISTDMRNYQTQTEEDARGNSPRSSPGSSANDQPLSETKD